MRYSYINSSLTTYKEIEESISQDDCNELNLHGNQISNLHDFPQIPLLQKLDLSSNNLSSFQFANLFRFPLIQDLDLSSNSISDLNFPNSNFNCQLRFLYIPFNHITSLSSIHYLSCLIYLDARGNQISHLEDMADLSKIQKLSSLLLKGSDGRYPNPICENVGYRSVIYSTFPQLVSLDGGDVETESLTPKFDAAFSKIKKGRNLLSSTLQSSDNKYNTSTLSSTNSSSSFSPSHDSSLSSFEYTMNFETDLKQETIDKLTKDVKDLKTIIQELTTPPPPQPPHHKEEEEHYQHKRVKKSKKRKRRGGDGKMKQFEDFSTQTSTSLSYTQNKEEEEEFNEDEEESKREMLDELQEEESRVVSPDYLKFASHLATLLDRLKTRTKTKAWKTWNHHLLLGDSNNPKFPFQ